MINYRHGVHDPVPHLRIDAQIDYTMKVTIAIRIGDQWTQRWTADVPIPGSALHHVVCEPQLRP